MIAEILAGLFCGEIVRRSANAGDKAVKRGIRSAKRTARNAAEDVATKVETVMQPCASGRAPHRVIATGEYYGDGSPVYACRVCGEAES